MPPVSWKKVGVVAAATLVVFGLLLLQLTLENSALALLAELVQHQQTTEPQPVPNKHTELRTYFNRDGYHVMIELPASGPLDPETRELQKIEAENRRLEHLQNKEERKRAAKIRKIRGYDYSLSGFPQQYSLDDARDHQQFVVEFRKFMLDLYRLMEECAPKIGGIRRHYKPEENKFPSEDGHLPVYGGHWREFYTEEPVRTKEYLLSFLRLSAAEVLLLAELHALYMHKMPKLFPEALLNAGRKSGFMQGDGIVYLGGGKYNQLVLLLVLVLRTQGSRLPIEVIMPKRSDVDIDFCSAMEKFNGRCVVMEDLFPEFNNLNGFQLKNAALLLASFKRILYLDADNIPMSNPDLLFVNEPFALLHMVMWPDLWRRSTSPHYYEVADIHVDGSFRARNSYGPLDERGRQTDALKWSFHDCKNTIPEASSETGQMLINREIHQPLLFLAMYYNMHGPNYYYPLLSQGAAGEGDKETIIAAAHKLELPYYQVMEFNREFGPLNGEKKHEIFGMGQYDAILDFLQLKDGMTQKVDMGKLAKNNKDPHKSNYEFHFYQRFKLQFLHANWPKYYFHEMFSQNSHGRGPKGPDGQPRRLYGDFLMRETTGYDIEKEIVRHLRFWFCNTDIRLQNLPSPGTPERKASCDSLAQHLKWLNS